MTKDEIPSHVRLQLALDNANVTPQRFAEIMGVERQTVWRWLRDPAEFPDSARKAPDFAFKLAEWIRDPETFIQGAIALARGREAADELIETFDAFEDEVCKAEET